MRVQSALIGVAALAVMTIVAPEYALAQRPPDRPIDGAQVIAAIDRGVAFLKSKQDQKRGNWPEWPTYDGGVTALCTLALINSGVPVDDPSVRRGLNYL